MKKMISLLFAISYVAVAFLGASPAAAESNGLKVLVVYNLVEEGQKDELLELDMLIGHFTSDITIKTMDEAVKEENIDEYTHVFYFGMGDEEPTREELGLLSLYQGPKFYIGNHMEYFKGAHNLVVTGYDDMEQILKGEEIIDMEASKSVMQFSSTEDMEIIYEGKSKQGTFPLMFSIENSYYLASDSITGTISEVLGEVLFSFFQVEPGESKKLLRLEDVHPKSDPVLLKEIGDYLAEENIPYAITVIPVYTNPKTGQQINIAQAIELVRVLQEMQDNGASIIMHGYYHQYREDETGEGSEYWDMKYDRPVYQAQEDPVYFREDFKTDEEYEKYIEKGLEFEEGYIYSTLQKGVSELIDEGLYPIAFEAPHYTMSHSGYEVLSNYFSTYVGQIQISNKTHEGTYVSLYDSQPSKLDGMQVIPETMGYVNPDNPNAVEEMLERAEHVAKFSDSYLAFFYHPYLGVEGLKEVIDGLKKYEDLEWLDLKTLHHKVEIDGIVIETSDGEINVHRPMGLLFTQTVKTMWWFAIPLLVLLAIVIITARARKKLINQ